MYVPSEENPIPEENHDEMVSLPPVLDPFELETQNPPNHLLFLTLTTAMMAPLGDGEEMQY